MVRPLDHEAHSKMDVLSIKHDIGNINWLDDFSMIVYLRLALQWDVNDDRKIRDAREKQHLWWNERDESSLFVVNLPCGETPDIGAWVSGSYLKPNNWLKSCLGRVSILLIKILASKNFPI